MISGTVAAKGMTYGKAFVLTPVNKAVDLIRIAEDQVDQHCQRFLEAIQASVIEIKAVKSKSSQILDKQQQQIFDSYLVLLEDDELKATVLAEIKEQLWSAESAVHKVFSEHAKALSQLKDPYLAERASDILDLGERIYAKLSGQKKTESYRFDHDVILVAHDLSPAQTVQLELDKIKGILTDLGGETSHTSILARSLEIPTIVGTQNATAKIKNNDLLLLDALNNQVIVNPDPEILQEFQTRIEHFEQARNKVLANGYLPAETIDGHKVLLAANISSPAELGQVIKHGADGIGLFRTEFLFMHRRQMPSEEEQFTAYQSVAQGMQGKAVIIRTMDVGGDKELPYLDLKKEANPFLGCRGIRLSLRYPQLLIIQLKSILRASAYGKVKIMFPMIATIEEIHSALALLKQAKEELDKEQLEYDRDIQVGVMIETPAAVAIARHLIRYVDFFSIGTNDLTQYVMAVDRGNQEIQDLYQTLSPAVLSMIHYVIKVAEENNKFCGICGELAGDEKAALLLVGMGAHELSMSAALLNQVREQIRRHNLSDVKNLSELALRCETAGEVAALLAAKH